jgi:hypothetical protein
MASTELSPAALNELARAAAFVFQGRVQGIGKNNLDGVEPDDRMATVRVDEVVVAPPTLGDLTGSTVTVYLESARGLKARERATFFATSWHYGATVGVVEIGRTSTPAKELRQRVLNQRLEVQHERLEARLRRSVLIVSGRVLSTFRTDATGLPGVDEGVEWWEAEMWVGSVEKGTPPPRLHIFYPVGGDREWGPVPKCHPDQVGVWLLGPIGEPDEDEKESERRATGKDSRGGLMALDPLDYQAISALPHIQELLRRTGER